MAVCLDTSFLVDLLSGEPSATAFARGLEEPAAIPAIAFYELLFGATGRRRRAHVVALAQDYAVLPADYEVCAMAATIQARLEETGEMIPVLDAIIAATPKHFSSSTQMQACQDPLRRHVVPYGIDLGRFEKNHNG